jgi:hypothetical protein
MNHDVPAPQFAVTCLTHPGYSWISRWRSQTGKTLACPPNVPHKQGFAALPGVVRPAKIMPSTLGRVVKESDAPIDRDGVRDFRVIADGIHRELMQERQHKDRQTFRSGLFLGTLIGCTGLAFVQLLAGIR